jgi:thiol-disulfide isomerase/thioredoxin
VGFPGVSAAVDGYNYGSYSWDLEQGAYERWLAEAPQLGEVAPDFELPDLAGGRHRLSGWRGRPVVVEFGSYTCPMFCDRIPAMEDVAAAHPEAVFVVVYSREAHPGERTGPHASDDDKRAAARRLAAEEPLSRLLLVDSLEGEVHRAYGAVWDPVFVLDRDGRVVGRLAWNDPDRVAALLDALAAGGPVEPVESTEMLRQPSPSGFGHGLLRGGLQALFDFHDKGPPGAAARLHQLGSADVEAALTRSGRTMSEGGGREP